MPRSLGRDSEGDLKLHVLLMMLAYRIQTDRQRGNSKAALPERTLEECFHFFLLFIFKNRHSFSTTGWVVFCPGIFFNALATCGRTDGRTVAMFSIHSWV